MGWLLQWTAWSGRRLSRACLITIAAWLLVPSRSIAVPGRDGVQSVLWPLVPTLIAIVLPSCLARAYGDLELTAGKPYAGQRSLFAALALAMVATACLGGLRFDLAIAARNAAFLSGLAFVSTVVLPPRIAWMPTSFVPIITWLFGLELGGGVRPWATLMQVRSSVPATLVAAGTLSVGLVTFIAFRLPLWRSRGDANA